MQKPYFFILGAGDPEMNEIERILIEKNIGYGYASTTNGRRVYGCNAYPCDDVIVKTEPGFIPVNDVTLVFVECSVLGLRPDDIIDHHRPGDPGYGYAPEHFMKGSSLGQFLTMLGIEPTQEQRIICAADHCLNHAYRGACPGIDPKDLAAWRLRSRAAFQNVDAEDLMVRIEEARDRLLDSPRFDIGGVEVAWVEDFDHSELAEASARYGIPLMYRCTEKDGRQKAAIVSAPVETIETWMRECQLNDVYGDPTRGYAGGYLPN